ncbi:MAG: glycosyltransferase [Pseudomonadota bacterium]
MLWYLWHDRNLQLFIVLKQTISKTVLFIGQVWPEPNTTAAGQNILSYVKALKQHQWNVHFWSAAEKTHHSFDLTSVDTKVLPIQINDHAFDESLKALMPDIVIFDRFISEEQFGWRVGDVCPDCLKIINLEDLHGLREARLLAFKKDISNRIPAATDIFAAENHELLFNDKTLREFASIIRSDVCITLSGIEYDWLQSTLNLTHEHLLHLPFIRDDKVESNLAFAQRKDIVFIGNMLHKPNQLAVKFIVEHLWASIRKCLPECSLHIYGEYAAAGYKQMHNPTKGIFMRGFAGDHKPVLASAKLLLAPIQVGAGVKGKLLDAMSVGTPSITTDIGAEGILSERDQWPGKVCSTAETMIKACVALTQSKTAWESASGKCASALEASGISMKNADRLVNKIEACYAALPELRRKNTIQNVLMHQSAQASRYLSKWIMLKNNL